MFWFGSKKRKKQDAAKEAEIQAIREEVNDKIKEAAEKTEKVNKLLEDKGGTTYLIFLATGGERRSGKH